MLKSVSLALVHWSTNMLKSVSIALVHKHVKISVDEWIMETTHPHKQAQIALVQIFFALLLST